MRAAELDGTPRDRTAPLARRPARRWRLAVSGLTVAILAWAPLPLGSNRPWSWSLLACLIGLTLAVWCVGAALEREPLALPWPLRLAGILLAAVLAWIGVQTMPVALPGWAHPLWQAVLAYGLDARPTISIEPSAATAATLRLVGCAGMVWLGYVTARDGPAAERLANALVAIAAAVAVWGLIRRFGGIAEVFWNVPGDPGAVSATFANRNHFATYANLGLVVAVSRLAAPLLDRARGPARRLVAATVTEILERRQPLFLAALTLLMASLLSGSRGGFLSLAGAVLTVVTVIALRRRASARMALLAGAVTLVLGAGLVWIGGSALLGRLDQLDQQLQAEAGGQEAGRLAAWGVTLDLIGQRPLAGYGYGTYPMLFRMARDERFDMAFDYAHDTYLEEAVELGLPAAVALCGCVLLLAWQCCRGLLTSTRSAWVPLAAIAATVLVGLHALVDFSLQIPAVGITFCAILGMGCAAARLGPGTRAAAPA